MSAIARARAGGSVSEKADYVRSERGKGAGGHHCHWPGCDRKVPPAMWGCYEHWRRLPASLRAKIWRFYSPGQEISKTPSPEYIEVAHEVREWAEKDDRRMQMINRGWEYDL